MPSFPDKMSGKEAREPHNFPSFIHLIKDGLALYTNKFFNSTIIWCGRYCLSWRRCSLLYRLQKRLSSWLPPGLLQGRHWAELN